MGAHAWSATAATDPWAAVADRTAGVAAVRMADAGQAPRACPAEPVAAVASAPAATEEDGDHQAFRVSSDVAANTAAASVRALRDDPHQRQALRPALPALLSRQTAAAPVAGRCAAARPVDVWRASTVAQVAEPSRVLRCAAESLVARSGQQAVRESARARRVVELRRERALQSARPLLQLVPVAAAALQRRLPGQAQQAAQVRARAPAEARQRRAVAAQ
jgi:hypothetical protein